MPTNIKISVSVIVALVGMGAFFLEQQFGDRVVGVVAILLAVFMILSIWVFPETVSYTHLTLPTICSV